MNELLQNVRGNQSSGISPETHVSHVAHKTPYAPLRTSGLGALVGYAALSLTLALFIRFFIAAPYVVSGSSMEPNFDNWDYLIADRVTYRFADAERGDIVVFHLPQQYSRSLIKRVIGLPHETISFDRKGVFIKNAAHPDGFYLSESYLAPENLGGPSGTSVTLGPDEYVVLGDNRRVSSDSRTWGILPKSNIVGRVILRLFPISKADILPEEARY